MTVLLVLRELDSVDWSDEDTDPAPTDRLKGEMMLFEGDGITDDPFLVGDTEVAAGSTGEVERSTIDCKSDGPSLDGDRGVVEVWLSAGNSPSTAACMIRSDSLEEVLPSPKFTFRGDFEVLGAAFDDGVAGDSEAGGVTFDGETAPSVASDRVGMFAVGCAHASNEATDALSPADSKAEVTFLDEQPSAATDGLEGDG